MVEPKEGRWVLAFDASCGSCRKISGKVAEASDRKLEVLPLSDEDVQRWREQAMGPAPKWAPTLIRVHGGQARAWTGPAMALPLVRRLGPRSALRIVNALGSLKRDEKEQPAGRPGERAMGRKAFLRLGAGASVAAALVFTGKSPAFAADGMKAAREWVKSAERLPERYADFSGYSVEYRKAIYEALTPRTRSRLWVEHLRHYRTAHAPLTSKQEQVVDAALREFSKEALFTGRTFRADEQRLEELKEAAISEFGREEAAALLATLGPAQDTTAEGASDYCDCNYRDDWCTGSYLCRNFIPCSIPLPPIGCGTGYTKPCDGVCW